MAKYQRSKGFFRKVCHGWVFLRQCAVSILDSAWRLASVPCPLSVTTNFLTKDDWKQFMLLTGGRHTATFHRVTNVFAHIYGNTEWCYLSALGVLKYLSCKFFVLKFISVLSMFLYHIDPFWHRDLGNKATMQMYITIIKDFKQKITTIFIYQLIWITVYIFS